MNASTLHSFILIFEFIPYLYPFQNTHKSMVSGSTLVVISILIHDPGIKFKIFLSMHITNINLICNINFILPENSHITER